MTGRDQAEFQRQFDIARGKLPTNEILEAFIDDDYDPKVRQQARSAYNTAHISRHIQLRLVNEQEHFFVARGRWPTTFSISIE